MAENLTCDWKAMVGPWPHDWPDDCVPGPNIAYLSECLRFWDYHLKGIKNGLDKEPRLRLYLEESKRNIKRNFSMSHICDEKLSKPKIFLAYISKVLCFRFIF
jgi:predicted acyl esterase